MSLTQSMSLQELHDQLRADRPEDANCPDDCPFCAGTYVEETPSGGMQMEAKTYSEDEVAALVAARVSEATAALTTELETFRSSEEAAEVEARIAAARTELEAQVADLTTKLDTAVAEALASKTAHDELVALLTAEDERVQAEAAAAERRDARIAQVAEVITFPEEHVKERADHWASLEDEAFEAVLADYKVLAEKVGAPSEPPLPTATAMQAAREPGVTTIGSSVRDLIRGRNLGVDPRTVR